jgi:hypothetical protein
MLPTGKVGMWHMARLERTIDIYWGEMVLPYEDSPACSLGIREGALGVCAWRVERLVCMMDRSASARGARVREKEGEKDVFLPKRCAC